MNGDQNNGWAYLLSLIILSFAFLNASEYDNTALLSSEFL